MIGRDPWREVSRVLVFAVAAAILLLSLLPRPPMSFGGLRWSDKIGHLLAYFLWGGCSTWPCPAGRPIFPSGGCSSPCSSASVSEG